MRHRFLALITVLAAATAVASLLQAPVAGQTSTAATTTGTARGAANWVVPRTPWGDPDLQGVWTSDDMRGVPLERPEQFGNRVYLTDEEFAQRDSANQEQRRRADNAIGTFRNDVGTRTSRQTSLIIDPPDGRRPALTPEAQQKQTAMAARRGVAPTSWEDRSLYDRCVTRGVLGSILPVIYGNGSRIVQAPGYFVISYEMVHDTRVIPLDGRPRLGQNIHQYMGDARGRWEGNTLVVETSNFTDKTAIGGNGNGSPNSESLRLVERFTRVDADTIDYEVTIEDPKAFTRPWKILLPLAQQPGYLLLPYECHEGNRALSSILSAARAEDKAAEEAARKGLPPPRPSLWLGGVAPAQPTPAAEPAAAESER